MDGAISDYAHSIKINPRFAEAYCNRGVARRVNGDIDGAIADYNTAISINPSHALAYLNRGLARMLQLKPAEALLDFDQCIRLDNSLEPMVREHVKTIIRQLDSSRKATTPFVH